MTDKAELRKQMRRIRSSLSVQRILVYSSHIYEKVLEDEKYQQCDVVLAYLSYSSEVETHILIQNALQSGKRVAVPKCLDGERMEFFYITDMSQVAPGMYGILEPTTGDMVCVEDGQKYVILLPGVAFDEKKYRLGYGGGYYDRYLEQHPQLYKMMLAYELEKVDEVPHDEKDIPSDVVITELQRYE